MMSEAVAEIQLTQEDIENQLPVPVGYLVLVALPQVEETYGDSGLVKSATTINHEHVMSIIGLVLDMGQQAYADEDRFPTGPWCKAGDYVMFRANTGTRFKVNGVESVSYTHLTLPTKRIV